VGQFVDQCRQPTLQFTYAIAFLSQCPTPPPLLALSMGSLATNHPTPFALGNENKTWLAVTRTASPGTNQVWSNTYVRIPHNPSQKLGTVSYVHLRQ
jgi:hypothetical protein